jgi:hypothetical protein
MASRKNLDSYIEETTNNIREDRDTVKYLLTDLLQEIKSSDHSHKEVGLIAAKYIETLQRSNEQLVKLASLIQKNTKSDDGLSLEDKQELFDLIREQESS